jgi:hypothetical protein
MRRLLFSFFVVCSLLCNAQPQKTPCTANPVYRQLDFWIGDWDVYGLNGKKAGDSRIELILDSCIILENWKSASSNYSGKSFNTYNSTSNQWQQTWVDNIGGTLEYLEGNYNNNRMTFQTKPFNFSKDTIAVRKLSLYNLSSDKVRQHFEITKDNGVTWKTEYDLQYRRRRS